MGENRNKESHSRTPRVNNRARRRAAICWSRSNALPLRQTAAA